MTIDPKLAGLLSDFFLDIAKAYFIAAFITPAISNSPSAVFAILSLTRTLLLAILFVLISWQLAKLEEKN